MLLLMSELSFNCSVLWPVALVLERDYELR